MGLIGIRRIRTYCDIQKLEEILKRNESVLRLVEAVGNVVADWDNLNPELDDQRPHQQRLCRELVPEIYRCLHLLWTLSDEKCSCHHDFSGVLFFLTSVARIYKVP